MINQGVSLPRYLVNQISDFIEAIADPLAQLKILTSKGCA